MAEMEVKFRWVEGPTASQEDWDRIEGLLAAKGWMSLNRATSRIRLAEDSEGNLLGFHVFQMMPYAGPLYVTPKARGTGLAEQLADDMLNFLADVQVRGFLVIADSPHTNKLCESRGMTKLEKPVYTMGGEG